VFCIFAGYRGGVAAETGLRDRIARARAGRADVGAGVKRLGTLLWGLVVSTTRICLRYRVTGLAAEAGFFALLSLPPLVLGLVGSIGFIGSQLGSEVVNDVRAQLRTITLTFLTADSVSKVILPTFDQVVGAGRADIVSIGFLLSLWSGSRVLNVYVDTISIMYGLGGHRGIVMSRVLSFSLYIAALLVGIVLIPLVLIGPTLLGRFFESLDWSFLASVGWTGTLYWTVVPVLAVTGLASLYHISTPIRSPWWRDLPGAVLALVIWVLASFLLRIVISASVGGASIYGPLATPIVVLIWLYFLAIAVLIGAALNAAIDERFPTPQRVAARASGGAYAEETQMTPIRDIHEDRVEHEP
jgi:membrane protein